MGEGDHRNAAHQAGVDACPARAQRQTSPSPSTDELALARGVRDGDRQDRGHPRTDLTALRPPTIRTDPNDPDSRMDPRRARRHGHIRVRNRDQTPTRTPTFVDHRSAPSRAPPTGRHQAHRCFQAKCDLCSCRSAPLRENLC